MIKVMMCACWLGCFLFGGAVNAEKLGITIDDLPSAGTNSRTISKKEIAEKIIAHLKKYNVPRPYGFVNGITLENQAERAEIMKLWQLAGFPIGNHTYSHTGYNLQTTEELKKDIARNEPFLLDYAKDIAEFKWLRLPYLQEGDTTEKRYALRSYLKERNYQLAQVTIDFEDWAFNDAYIRCLDQGKTGKVNAIRTLYLNKLSDVLSHAKRATQVIWGRDKKINHVMLIHFNAAFSAFGDDFFKLIKEKGWDLIPADEAMRDPTYTEDTTYVSKDGKTFLDQALITRKIKTLREPLSLEDKLATFCK